MKIYLVEVLIYLSLCIEPTLLENIEIRRFIGKGESWETTKDSFYIPKTVCDQVDSRYKQYCASHHICKSPDPVTDNPYLCSCPPENATLTYGDNLWRCRENVEVRRHFGCEMNNIFHEEEETEPLRVLRKNKGRKTELNEEECHISPDSSWYIGCDGKRETLKAYQKSFELKRNKKNPKAYFLKVLDDSYQGQIIKLGIRCTSMLQAYNNSCLLFKVQGNVFCPLGKQETDRLSSTTAAFSETTSTPSKVPTETSTQTKQSSTEGRFQPSSGVRQTDDSTSQVPVIVGVTASIILTIVLLVVAFLICRRYKSRQEKHESKKKVMDWMLRKRNPTANSETDTSQTGNSYGTLEIPGGSTYGDQNVNESDYSVPHGPKDESLYYGSVSIDQPEYSIVEDVTVKIANGAEEGPYTMEPTYNVLEEPYPDSSKSPSNHGTLSVNEPFAEEGPYTMEPTYNVLEEPYPDSSKSPSNHGTLSVNEPFYNSLERSYSNDGFGDNQGEVVYNTLEEPGVTGADEEDNYSNTALKEHVYNVLDRRGIRH